MSLTEAASSDTQPRQTLVVGDIQGCYKGLKKLLDKADFDPGQDRLVAVGDLIARGEGSLATVEYLMSLGSRFSAVLGNHDLHFLAVCAGIRKAKKNDKLQSLLDSKKLPGVVDWLRQFPLALRLDQKHLVVHAGLYPLWSTDQILTLSNEVSAQLQGPQWQELLSNMYGANPHHWSENLSGYDRLRFIINATTRMRFIKGDRDLEFAHKGPPEDGIDGLTPWFQVPNPHLKSEETILFGHWAALAGDTRDSQFIGLDTGYVWGQTMTALCMEKQTFVRVKA